MAHVFISYSHQDDTEFLAKLKQEIENSGIEYWTDEKISPGEQWSRAIDEAIKSAFALVVVMSPVATESQYITYEWSYAMGLGKIIIPLVATKGTKLHPKLSELQHIDFTNKKPENWTRLMNTLRTAKDMPEPTAVSPQIEPKYTVLHDFKGKNSTGQRNAIRVEADLKNMLVIPDLIQIVNDQKAMPSVREEAAWALGELEAQEAIPTLLFLLINTKGRGLRRTAAISLGKLGAFSAVSALVDTLIYHYRDMHLREVISKVLAQIGQHEDHQSATIQKLKSVLFGIEPNFIKEDIADTLNLIGTPEAFAVIEEWKHQHQPPPATS